MGYEPIDAEYEMQMDAIYDGVLEQYYNSDAYHEDISRGIEEFIDERQRSFYLEKPDVAKPAFDLLGQAGELFNMGQYGAAQVFAGAAAELTFGDALLKPMVYGLAHSDTVAPVLAGIIENARSVHKFKALLVAIVSEFSGIDLTANVASLSNRSLWSYVDDVRRQRNAILHGDGLMKVNREDAELALTVASELFHKVLPSVLAKIGLHLHDATVCSKSHT